IGRYAREAVQARSLPDDSPLYGIPDVTGKDVSKAAYAGDAGAAQVLATAGRWLGVGIASLVNGLDPEIVIIGGGAVGAGAFLLDPAIAAYHERVIARTHRTVPPVVAAQL